MKMTEKTLTTLTTYKICKLHPRLITIEVKNSRLERDVTTINLPITNDVYTLLILNFSKGNIAKNYPFVFFINDKGTATKVLPQRLYIEEKAEADKQKEIVHAHSGACGGQQDTPKSAPETQIDPENTPKHPL